MARAYTSFFSLLLSTGILLIGNGLQSTLISVRGDIEEFSGTIIGLVGAFYFAGFLIGSYQSSVVVKRAGHIRAFAAFASLASVTPLLHALFPQEIVWMVLRALSGYCFAGIYLIIESWLNEQASNEMRGRLFGIYLGIHLISIMLGQLILNVASPSGIVLFVLASILVSISVVPLTLTKSVQPRPIETARVNLPDLWRMSPIGTVGCLVVGLISGPFWTLAPVFVRDAGFDVKGVSFFMTAVILGGAFAQYPIGYLSDRTDRRWVIVLVSVCAAIGEAALVVSSGRVSEAGFYAIAFCLGMFSHSLYSICVAQANDHTREGDFVVVSGGLLFLYSVGAVVGPLVTSFAMLFVETYVIYVYSAVVHAVFALFVVVLIARISPLPREERREFVAIAVSRTGPEPVELDPRTESQE